MNKKTVNILHNVGVTVLMIMYLIPGLLGRYVQAMEASAEALLTESSNATESALIDNPTPTPIHTPSGEDIPPLMIPSAESVTPEVPEQLSQPLDPIQSARVKRKARVRKLPRNLFHSNERINIGIQDVSSQDVDVTLIDNAGKEVPVDLEKSDGNRGASVTVLPPREFKPGAYTLVITDWSGTESKQEFTWGVLAINTNKSIYTPGETAAIAIGVLDESGEMVCNAQVTLDITDPDGDTVILTTHNQTIRVNSTCTSKSLSLKPDYETSYQTSQKPGKYVMVLRAITKNGSYTITDMFETRTDIPFDIERIGPTRIYPPLSYPVRFNIRAQRDFSGTIEETVPESFQVVPPRSDKGISYTRVYSTDSSEKSTNVLGIATASLGKPFSGDRVITQGFGEHPDDADIDEAYTSFGLTGHDGVDFDMSTGNEVLSVDDGTVISMEEESYGKTVIIKHPWGKSYYGHLNNITVTNGEHVFKGKMIGQSGSTGLSTGPHLHFAIEPNDPKTDNGFRGKIDPLPYIGISGSSVLGVQHTVSPEKHIVWEVNVKKGEQLTLGYEFDAPDISPELFLLGPLVFRTSDTNEVFRELREWQIASDAPTSYQYIPNSGNLVLGYERDVTMNAASNIEGLNLGSWKATISDDNYHWQVGSTTSGMDVQLNVGSVSIGTNNTMIIQTEFDLDATVPTTLVQICDWVSSTSVDNAADTMCTGGGWRTLNNAKTGVTIGTPAVYQWNIYDGYWTNGSNTAISTPLSNFVNGINLVKVRYYSTTNTTSVLSIDHLRVYTVVNPIYTAGGFTNLGTGTVTGDYSSTNAVTQGASDNSRLEVAGTAGSVADFYLSFKNVQTYTGMNTVLMRAEYSCSNTGPTHRPKIYNFNSASWEDLSTSSIACSTTDATSVFAKNNVTISNYISNGEIRVGWRGLSNSTVALRIDFMYIMVGTTNTNTSDCEISFGTVSAGDCSATRDIDTTATTNSWNITTEDESTNRGTGEANSYYAQDTDADANIEEAAASHVKFAVTPPSDAQITSTFVAGRFMSGTAGTVQIGLRDYSGTSNSGGFVAITTATTTLSYIDPYTTVSIVDIGMAGIMTNADSYVDEVQNQMWIRLRTSVDGATTNNSVNQFDFAFVSLQWVTNADKPTKTYKFAPTGETLVTGTEQSITSATASSTEGTNVGSWKGTIADDSFHWTVASTASGIDMQLNIGNVALNGANTLIVQTDIDLDATAPNLMVQICDWVSSTSVDNAADAQCTTGGWRTFNNRKTAITTATPTAYHWQIYDGYWSNGSNTAISTPLSNFVNGSNTVKIRYYASNNTTSVVAVDFLRVYAVVNPVYTAGGFTNLGTGTVTGDYTNSTVISQGASDNTRISAAGTASSVADFYLSFYNVKTYQTMNTIVVRAEYGCSSTGPSYRPRIYNFTTISWEDLTPASIACTTTDATSVFAKNNITMADYVSGGEIRVGWRGLSNSTVSLRIDLIYIMLGTTNTDSSRCEISLGGNNANDCSSTRDMDTLSTENTWDIRAENESPSGTISTHDTYAFDQDMDVTSEDAASSNISFAAVNPTNTTVTALFFAGRMTSGTAGTVILGLKDYSGFSSTTGGWSVIGVAATTTQSYTDNITTSGVSSGGPAGYSTNAQSHIDKVNCTMNLRLRTSVDATGGTQQINAWDFAMVSIQWVESTTATTTTVEQAGYRFFVNNNGTNVGGQLATMNTAASVNTTGSAFRLRMLLHIGTTTLSSSGMEFKLQFARKGAGTCIVPAYDYANITTSSEISFYNNGGAADGAALSTNSLDPTHSGHTIIAQTYDESNPFTNSQGSITAGQDGMWDFSLFDNGALPNTTYCFRIVKSDGAMLDTYTVYPEMTTYNSKIGKPTLEQSSTTNVTSAASLVVTMNKPVTTGNLLIVAVSKWDSGGTTTITGVTDNKSNSYAVASQYPSPYSGATQSAIYYAQNVTGGNNVQVTVSVSGSTNRITVAVFEYSGMRTSGVLDEAGSTLTSSTTSPSTVTTAHTDQDIELVFAIFTATTATSYPRAGSGYTMRSYYVNNLAIPLVVLDKITTAAGTQVASLSVDTADTFQAHIATFKAANTGPTLDKVTRHGKWFTIDGVKQPDTY